MESGGFWLLLVLIVLAFVIFRARKSKKTQDKIE